jgi:hypothetical protein
LLNEGSASTAAQLEVNGDIADLNITSCTGVTTDVNGVFTCGGVGAALTQLTGDGTTSGAGGIQPLTIASIAHTWTAKQLFAVGEFALNNTNDLTINVASGGAPHTLTLPAGTTDFSATGGTSQVVKQSSAGAAFTVGQLSCSDLSGGCTGTGIPTSSQNVSFNFGVTGTYYDNSAASGTVVGTLPAWAAGDYYCFSDVAGHLIEILAPASATISYNGTVSAAAGNIISTVNASSACVYATAVSNKWVAVSATGGWTVN